MSPDALRPEESRAKPDSRTALSAVVAPALLLTGCGDDGNGSAAPSPSPTPSVPAGEHNRAAVDFAQGVIPHRRQARHDVRHGRGPVASRDVEALAGDVITDRKAEITRLRQMFGTG